MKKTFFLLLMISSNLFSQQNVDLRDQSAISFTIKADVNFLTIFSNAKIEFWNIHFTREWYKLNTAKFSERINTPLQLWPQQKVCIVFSTGYLYEINYNDADSLYTFSIDNYGIPKLFNSKNNSLYPLETPVIQKRNRLDQNRFKNLSFKFGLLLSPDRNLRFRIGFYNFHFGLNISPTIKYINPMKRVHLNIDCNYFTEYKYPYQHLSEPNHDLVIFNSSLSYYCWLYNEGSYSPIILSPNVGLAFYNVINDLTKERENTKLFPSIGLSIMKENSHYFYYAKLLYIFSYNNSSTNGPTTVLTVGIDLPIL